MQSMRLNAFNTDRVHKTKGGTKGADWSRDGAKIIFTSHSTSDDPNNSAHAEIYTINPDGTGLARLTFNDYEERAPSWSPDGSRIAFMARVGTHPGVPGSKFEIRVMNADGTNF